MTAATEPLPEPDDASGEPDVHTSAGKLADWHRRQDDVVHAGSERAVERQHAKGRKTARERLDLLLDEGSFLEFDAMARHRSTNFGLEQNRPYGDGVVTGQGTIDGRPVCVFSQDATVFGGALGEVYGEKIVKVMDVAMKIGCPVVGINDGGGARIQEGVVALGLYGEISGATCTPRASSPRSRWSWARRPAVRCTPRRSPTSRSWSTRRRSCSSPAPT